MGFVPPTYEEWKDIKKLAEWANRRQQERRLFGIATAALCSIGAMLIGYSLIIKG